MNELKEIAYSMTDNFYIILYSPTKLLDLYNQNKTCAECVVLFCAITSIAKFGQNFWDW